MIQVTLDLTVTYLGLPMPTQAPVEQGLTTSCLYNCV